MMLSPLVETIVGEMNLLRDQKQKARDIESVKLMDDIIFLTQRLPELDNPNNVIHAVRSIVRSILSTATQTNTNTTVLREALTCLNSLEEGI